MVLIDFGFSLILIAPLNLSRITKFTLRLESLLYAITQIFPSGRKKAIVLMPELVLRPLKIDSIRVEPGRMNREKCAMIKKVGCLYIERWSGLKII